MPAAIPFAITAIGTAVGGSTLLYGALALASSVAISSYQQGQAKKKAREQYNAAQVDRMANVVTGVGRRELVLGRVRKGGTVAFRGTVGQYNEWLLVHITLAAHEIDAVEAVYFNDQKVTINPFTSEVQDAPYMETKKGGIFGPSGVFSGPVLGPDGWNGTIAAGQTTLTLPLDPVDGSIAATVTPPQGSGAPFTVPFTYAPGPRTLTIAPQQYDTVVTAQYYVRIPHAWVWWDLGAPGAKADAETKKDFPSLWTDAHRGEGVAKLYAMFSYSETAFPSGVPNITVQMRGAKVYDPRDGGTRWTDNPALLARHVYQHPNFGKATISAAEDARFIAAINACNVTQNWVVNGATQTYPLYRAGMVVPYGASAASALDDLTQAMAGRWAFAGGELYIAAGVYTAPVMTFTDADVASIQRNGDSERQEAVTISVHRERAEKFNVVNVRLWDELQDFKEAATPPLKGSALIAADGQELPQEMKFNAVSYAPQALHVAGVMMRDARDPLTIQVPLKMRAYPVELFDTVQFAFSRYGWNTTPKTFIVVDRGWDREQGVIRLTCKETSAAIFTPDAAFLAQGYAQNTALPSPWGIEPPGTLVITSGTSELLIGADGSVITRVRVSWPAIQDQRVTAGGQVEVQWMPITGSQWFSEVVNGDVTQLYLKGIGEGSAIMVRARTRTTLAQSDWGLQQVHVVVGKTEPPGPPTGVSITQELVFFRPPADPDLAGIRIRSIAGNVASPVFSRGTDVIDGLVAISPARIERRLFGVQTIMVIAEDTSGNQSAPAYAVLDFGAPDAASAVWNRVFAAEAFPGTYTACSLSGGSVVANVDPSSDVYALDNLYGEPDVYATLYQAMQWQSALVVPPYGGTLALSDTLAGNSPTVEYRVSGDVITDLYASSDVYASADLYGAPGQWTLWPGALQVPRATPLEFRVSIAASSEQGAVNTFTTSLIMDSVAQTFTNVTVDAAGTRLVPSAGSPTRTWVGSISAIYGSPAVDGSGAIALRALDYSPTLGPMVQFVDNTGSPVTAKGTIKVEGFSDE